MKTEIRFYTVFLPFSKPSIAIGENFTSADLGISTFECGRTYEPSYMEDAYDDARQPSGKRAPEVNPLLVQVVLQIFMVKFCLSKIRSWYPSDSTIEEFLDVIYSEIRATGKSSDLDVSLSSFPDVYLRGPSRFRPMASRVLLLVLILDPALKHGPTS